MLRRFIDSHPGELLKVFQAIVFIGAPLTLFFAWDWKLFVAALLWGWLICGLGASICLHRYSGHKSFEPKNKLIKILLLFFGTISTLGSTIHWAAGHRMHHAKSDTKDDPHNPKGSFWHKIKEWFYYFPKYNTMPYAPKDLVADKTHWWFHKNYFYILFLYVGILSIFGIEYVGYFYSVSVLYALTGMSWATVLAHIPETQMFGYRTYNTKDLTYNSQFWTVLFWGEGYHNNHHANPGMHKVEILDTEFDLCGRTIELIGIPNHVTPKKYDPPRRGKELKKEFLLMKQELLNEKII